MPCLTPQMLLCFNVYATSHAFTRLYRTMLEPLGLTYPQFLVILSLGAEDGQCVGRLSTDLGLDTNTLSPLLKRMEAAGQIARSRSLRDERKVHVTLTGAGRSLSAQAAAIPARIVAIIGLDPAEGAATTATLERLRRALSTVEGTVSLREA